MKNLKGVRRASGLSQMNLSMRSGVSLSRIVKSEIAGLELRPEEIAAIRKILGSELAKSISLALEFQAGA